MDLESRLMEVLAPEDLLKIAFDVQANWQKLSPDEKESVSALTEKLYNAGSKLRQNEQRVPQKEAKHPQFFILVRNLRTLLKSERTFTTAEQIIMSQQFDPELGHDRQAPIGITSIVAGQVTTAIGGRSIRETFGVRYGLRVVEHDERITLTRRPGEQYYFPRVWADGKSEKYQHARKRVCRNLLNLLGKTAGSMGFNADTRVTVVDDVPSRHLDRTLARDIEPESGNDVEFLADPDGKVTADEILAAIKDNLSDILSFLARADNHHRIVGSVRDGGKRNR